MSEKREITAMEFLKEYKRMCDNQEPRCQNCGIAQTAEYYPNCGPWIAAHPEEAIAIVQKWAEEHPVKTAKTMLQDFFEKFPKADKEADGTPEFCPTAFYDVDGLCGEEGIQRCVVCWNRPLEVEP